jgi:hypothetical protein
MNTIIFSKSGSSAGIGTRTVVHVEVKRYGKSAATKLELVALP